MTRTDVIAARFRNRRWRLAVFAGGDFAFNLYWQSAMLFLLFYYTDLLRVPVTAAVAIFAAASVWDGLASFAIGVVADRWGSERRYRLALVAGAGPLALAFVAAYLPPPVAGGAGMGLLLVAHLAFRTAYAAVNLPYLAMSARISADSGDRALVAGLRMLAGSAAGVLVALGTGPLGGWLGAGARAYVGAALVFAGAGALILAAVGRSYRDGVAPERPPPARLAPALRTLASNRAFVTLAAAMMAVTAAAAIIAKSILYYFKYRFGDLGAGQLTLATMLAVSAAATPAWMLAARVIGARGVFFAASGLGSALLAAFAALDVGRAGVAQAFLIAMQVALAGLSFAFWALLPDTVEYGQRATGMRVEAITYGLAALLGRVAIGAATLVLGWTLERGGFVANAAPTPPTLDALRWTTAAAPLALLLLAAALMLANPLRRGEHARVLAELTPPSG